MVWRPVPMAIALAAVLALPAAAHARTRHYFGHTTCVHGSSTCPKQRHEVTMEVRGGKLRGFTTSVVCSSPDGGTSTESVTVPATRVHRHGRFDARSRRNAVGKTHVKGRVKGRAIHGKVDFDLPPDPSADEPSCGAHGVRFTAKLKKHRMYRPGSYRGTTRCAHGDTYCPSQSFTIAMRLTRRHALDVSADVTCQNPDRSTDSGHFTLHSAKIDWYGNIFGVRHDDTGDYSVSGTARGGKVHGSLDYERIVPSGSCSVAPLYRAHRTGG